MTQQLNNSNNNDMIHLYGASTFSLTQYHNFSQFQKEGESCQDHRANGSELGQEFIFSKCSTEDSAVI